MPIDGTLRVPVQVSSAFGRAMESVDRARVSAAVFPALKRIADTPGWAPQLTANALACAAEGYAFPTNLDRAQPVDGMTPDSQADLVRRALQGGWSESDLEKELAALRHLQRSH